MNILFFIIFLAILVIFLIHSFKAEKLNTKKIVTIAVLTALSIALSFVKIVRFPTGGAITLFSKAPILLLALMYNYRVGSIGGLLFGLIYLIIEPILVHPLQILLDYIIPFTSLGLISIFIRNLNINKKININLIMGFILTFLISISSYTWSGSVFFSEYAPNNLNPLVYSLSYNLMTSGIDLLLSFIAVYFFQNTIIKKFKSQY